MIFPETFLDVSGERFRVHYQVQAEYAEEARSRAHGICLEQTVEAPDDLLGQDVRFLRQRRHLPHRRRPVCARPGFAGECADLPRAGGGNGMRACQSCHSACA
jgi:hypothetical protein